MLTATPIQNRLWDLYSLMELLTVAKGHENPFGSEGVFARRFIADSRDKARRLRAEARDEFRSIVYGYMSRIRRGDANLYFPERIVQMHRVVPTPAETKLIATIAGPIQKLNRLAQISILQALASSPDALKSQLENMARRGTIPRALASDVRDQVESMPASAKLNGLGVLIDHLVAENSRKWRLVVFTGRLETQTTIQAFLEEKGLKVGIINGLSGARNQETIKRFRVDPPDIHVIVSTEAGSEGVNIQVANVLVNFDLPWNPMIVEQRIGRIQRLASEHAKVAIFNIILQGTFEEFIVGRLMEKLQLASHAIGDIEALLEASGIAGGDDDSSFEEQICDLVLAALAGKDVETATRQAEESIAEAKRNLEREEENINAMLGSMDGTEYVGPRAPNLPPVIRSMNARDFILGVLRAWGATITPHRDDILLCEQKGAREYICFEARQSPADVNTTLYAPGSPAFSRLVGRTIATSAHCIDDMDEGKAKDHIGIAAAWAKSFGGKCRRAGAEAVKVAFDGTALLRVRALVAHDSYERLLEVPCASAEHHKVRRDASAMPPMSRTIEDLQSVGINEEELSKAVALDVGVSEFCRFYLERRDEEAKAAGANERKRRKLFAEFTPRLEVSVVGLEGKLHRQVKVKTVFRIESDHDYEGAIVVSPSTWNVLAAPPLGHCVITGRKVPETCLGKCEISGKDVLTEYLVTSEISGRRARPEHTVTCSLSGQRILTDEGQASAVTGRTVATSLLKISALSGKSAEPTHFARCAFTAAEALRSELAVSEVSGKLYRPDEEARSAVSGKKGHKSEFISCHETRHILLVSEAASCEVTGHQVRADILEKCAVTQKRVLPDQLERCAATGKRAVKRYLVTSTISGARLIEGAAVWSTDGKPCTPAETVPCMWSAVRLHPSDIVTCQLTGLLIGRAYASKGNRIALGPLVDQLDGVQRATDKPEMWETITTAASSLAKTQSCALESSVLSPDGTKLAVTCEIRKLLGLRIQIMGLVYALDRGAVLGRIALGKRRKDGWEQ